MISTIFKSNFRKIKKQRFYALLNVAGLALGFASVILILRYVQYESGFDRFYPDHDRIFRINTAWENAGNEEVFATSPNPLASAIKNEIAETESVTRIYRWSDFTMRPETDMTKIFRETNVWLADPEYFDVFQYGFIQGDPKTALEQPASIVLPRSTAIRYFGQKAYDQNQILGKNILGGKDAGTEWKITAIIEDQPKNSHIQFDMLIAASTLREIYIHESWTWPIMHTYVKFNSKISPNKYIPEFKSRLHEIVEKYAIPNMDYSSYEEFAQSEGSRYELIPQPLTNIHLNSHLLREMGPNGNQDYVHIFMAVAGFIILLACVNFMNLSTALSTTRAKEVGVKKALGSSRWWLIIQFLSESLLFSLCGLFLSFGLIEIFVKFAGINTLTEVVSGMYNPSFLATSLAIAILIGILAGLYPAIHLTRFKPQYVLKGTISIGKKPVMLRNILVTFQLVISITLLICTGIVIKQAYYIQNRNLGFKKENVIIIQNDKEIDERREEFIDVLLRDASIISASFSTGIPGLSEFHTRSFTLPEDTDEFGIRWYESDENYISTLGMDLVSGRNFNSDYHSDSSSIILNESAVEVLGLENPIGSQLIKNKGAVDEQLMTVIGVVKDFNYESFHQKIKPLAIEYLDNFVFKDYISIRIRSENMSHTVSGIQDNWRQFEPSIPITFSFLDQDFDALFESEMNLKRLLIIFTGLAMLIACLGLFGLSTFTAAQRKKEIGIRKVFGASILQIMTLLSTRYNLLIVAGFLISSPVAYWMMSGWLADFEYKTNMGWLIFPLAGLITFIIVQLTVSYQSFQTAVTNPSHSLKDE